MPSIHNNSLTPDDGTRASPKPLNATRRDKGKDRQALGRRMRELRQEQGRTLQHVASAAGVSISLLSQVERGKTDPSLEALRDIADALGTSPFRLFAGGSARSRLVRADQRPQLALPDTEIVFELLSPSLEGTFEVMLLTIAPGGSNPPASHNPRGHRGEEAILILGGRARFELGDEVFELSTGDFITYDGQEQHRMTALGAEPVTGLSVVSPPSF